MQGRDEIREMQPAGVNADDPVSNTRRRLLKIGAVLAAGAVANTVLNQEEAAAAGPLSAQSNNPGLPAVTGYHSNSGIGVWGRSVTGRGVVGVNEQNEGAGVVGQAFETGTGVEAYSKDGTAVDAHSETGVAVQALADDNTAIKAESTGWTAIRAVSDIDVGVWASSDAGIGVRGVSSGNSGVVGESQTGPGVQGKSADGVGVHGQSVSEPAVFGEGTRSIGVRGTSNENAGVAGDSREKAGVHGTSASAQGVLGFSANVIGVEGVSSAGKGVSGYSVSEQGVFGRSYYGVGVHGYVEPDHQATAVRAEHAGRGRALEVFGASHFSTAGNGVIPAGLAIATVHTPKVTADSHISVTLMGNPNPPYVIKQAPITIHYVERMPGAGFDLHLTAPVAQDTPFTFFIVDPV